MFDVPVALVVFNRPEPTAISFDAIARLRPRQLFLISDAARPDRPGEAQQVAECRRIAERVDWDCDLRTIFAETNLGCGRRISSGISEAFESVDRLIVLEDDCAADPSFFTFCDAMLDRYASDDRVMAVSGNNFQMGRARGEASYYFSKYPHCWGWATWRRAWQHFDLTIPNWPAFRDAGGLAHVCDSPDEVQYWTEAFDKVHAGRSQSWAFPWMLACWMNSGLTILPAMNLVSNIGFGEQATHTRRQTSLSNLKAESMGPIVHPDWVVRHAQADRFTDRTIFSGTVRRDPFKRIERAIRSLRKAG